jgi:transposase
MTPPTRNSYLTDLTDAQWHILQPLLPAAKPGGRPRAVDMREIINTILYLNRTGCQWDRLPHDLLPKSTVYEYFAQWRDDGTWRLEVVRRPAGSKGFVLLPKRWVVERTLAWLGRCRRNSKDSERRTDSSESMIRISAMHLMLKRLKPSNVYRPFRYRDAA